MKNFKQKFYETIYIICLFSLGALSYYTYDNVSVIFGKPQPLKYLCLKGKMFQQIEFEGTVYLKTNQECHSTEKKVMYAL